MACSPDNNIASLWNFLVAMENSLVVPQKLNIDLYDPAVPLLGAYPEELKAGTQTEASIPTFTAALFAIAKVQTTQVVYQQKNG